MRILISIALVSLAASGCVDGPGSPPDGFVGAGGGGGGGASNGGGGGTQASPDLGMPADMTALPPDLMPPPDLFPADIAGLTNCYGVALCDPQLMFCIKYHDGSQTTPGKTTGGPACYSPSMSCADQQQNMDCGCIQADNALGVACQGSCVDHGDGTYDCYAMP